MSMIDHVARRLNPKAFEIFHNSEVGSLERGLAITDIAIARTDARAAIAALRDYLMKSGRDTGSVIHLIDTAMSSRDGASHG